MDLPTFPVFLVATLQTNYMIHSLRCEQLHLQVRVYGHLPAWRAGISHTHLHFFPPGTDFVLVPLEHAEI